jgi:hypothetical protein
MMFRSVVIAVSVVGSVLLTATQAGAQVTGDPVTVEVKGHGESLSAARKDAIRLGLAQIVGEYVESDMKIENGEVVEDIITSFAVTDGVQSKELDKGFDDDGVWMLVAVTATPRVLAGKLEEAMTSAFYLDGAALAAEIESMQGNAKAAAAKVEEAFTGLCEQLLYARLIDREGKPLEGGRPGKGEVKLMEDGQALLGLNTQIYFDLESYYTKVRPNLDAILMAVASGRKIPQALLMQGSPSVSKTSRRLSPAAFSGYPRMSPTGHLSPAVPYRVEPHEVIVFLSAARDQRGSSETFDAFIVDEEFLPEGLVTPTFNPVPRNGPFGVSLFNRHQGSAPCSQIRLGIESGAGDLFAQRLLPAHSLVEKRREGDTHSPGHGTSGDEPKFRLRVDNEKLCLLKSSQLTGMVRVAHTNDTGRLNIGKPGVRERDNPEYSDNRARFVIISPRFFSLVFTFSSSNRSAAWIACDAITSRSEILMDPETLEKIARINVEMVR